jgi:hypothetical protein
MFEARSPCLASQIRSADPVFYVPTPLAPVEPFHLDTAATACHLHSPDGVDTQSDSRIMPPFPMREAWPS